VKASSGEPSLEELVAIRQREESGMQNGLQREGQARKDMAHLRRLSGEQKLNFFTILCNRRVANAFHYNAMLSALSDSAKGRTLLLQMIEAKITPDVVTYTSLITLEMRLGNTGKAEIYLTEMKAAGLKPNVRTHSALVEGYGKRGTLDRVLSSLKRMEEDGVEPNEFILASVMDACAKRGATEEAEEVFDRLTRRAERPIQPNKHVFTVMIDLYARVGSSEKIKEIWTRLKESDVRPDTALCNAYISCMDKISSLAETKAAYNEMALLNVPRDIKTYTTLINAYSQRGLILEARELYKETCSNVARDAQIMCIMMDGYCKVGRLDEAIEMLNDLVELAANPPHGAEWMGEVDRRKADAVQRQSVLAAFNTILDGHMRNDREHEAMDIMARLQKTAVLKLCDPPDVRTFTIIASGSRGLTHGTATLKMVRSRMEQLGIMPDETFFRANIEVASVSNNVREAVALFHEAVASHVAPGMDRCAKVGVHEVKLDCHEMSPAVAVAALEAVLRASPREIAAWRDEAPSSSLGGVADADFAPSGGVLDDSKDLVVVTGGMHAYQLEKNLVREAVEFTLRQHKLKYFGVDHNGERRYVPNQRPDPAAGRLMIYGPDWDDFRRTVEPL